MALCTRSFCIISVCVYVAVEIAMLEIQFDFNAMQIVQMKSCSVCVCVFVSGKTNNHRFNGSI